MNYPWGRLLLAVSFLVTMVAADGTDKVLGARCQPAKAGRWGVWCFRTSYCTGPKSRQSNRCVEGETTPTPEIVCCIQSGPAPPEEVIPQVLKTTSNNLDCTPLSTEATPLSTEATHLSTRKKSWRFREKPTTPGNFPTKRPCVSTTAASTRPSPTSSTTATTRRSAKKSSAAMITLPTPKRALEIAKKMCSEYSEYATVTRQVPATGQHCTMLRRQLLIGGTMAYRGDFPHMINLEMFLQGGSSITCTCDKVALGYDPPGGDSIEYRCGGSLISPLFVLTAAHCTFAKRTGPVRWALLGCTELDDPDARPIKIIESLKPASYSPLSNYDDIALLRLEHAPVLSPTLRPACVAIKDVEDLSHRKFGTAFDVCGWGLNVTGATQGSNTLMMVDLYQRPMKMCEEIFRYMNGSRELKDGIRRDSMLCIGNKFAKKDVCKGDSGGPVQRELNKPYCMPDVTAITSFGSNTCGGTALTASLYTNVRYYLPWIVSIVWPEELV